ncbi:MAG: EAL domain-containing response regulator [Hahellaceae bacterium]|nr:EAL domain-containing response regulator [Hahellaceae bacterium]MCP5211711.1 EAL domain-containing response regulator [Hahellaceae bacterium]
MISTAIIAEDSKSLQDLLLHHLEALGVREILCCDNGEDALLAIKGNPSHWECVITDLHMPVMDGLELLEALGNDNYRGGVIIASSLEDRVVQMAVDIALSHKVHLVGSLAKPIDAIELTRLLQKSREIKGFVPLEVKYLKQRELLDSISNNRILPYYQPKVDNRNGQLIGMEVLCRLDCPEEHQVISPDRFIPVAEKFNLIDLLTRQLLEQSLKDYKRLCQSLGCEPKLAFNISPLQLHNPKFPTAMGDICDRAGIDRGKVIFEVTERQIMSERKQLITLDRLRIHGFGLSLDDFGTGFTNIRQLREFPFTEVKVDRCLIKNISKDRVSQVILRALSSIAQEFNMALVAEGIEELSDYQYIAENFHLIAQGFLISRPKSIDEIIRWHHAWLKTHPIEATEESD